MKTKVVLIFSLVVMSFLYCAQEETVITPIAEKGFVDLTQWDFDGYGNIELGGEWEFYWNRLLLPEDFKAASPSIEPIYMTQPAVWNDMVIEGEQIDGNGFATYRLIVKLPSYIIDEQQQLGLKIPYMSTAYNLYLNGKFKASNGTVGTTRDNMVPQYLPKEIYFETSSATLEIVIQVSNFYHEKGGIREYLFLGNNEDILYVKTKNLALELILFGSIFIIGLYNIAIFLLRRQARSPLYFGLLCIFIAIRIIITGETFLVYLFNDINWEVEAKIEYINLFLLLPLFGLFIKSLFKQEISSIFIYTINVLIGILCLIVLFTTVSFYSQLLGIFFGITLIGILYSLVMLVVSVIRKREAAKLFLLSFLIFALTIINDMLFVREEIHTGYLMPYGLLTFVFMQSFIISYRFSKAFTNNEILLKNIEEQDKFYTNVKDAFLLQINMANKSLDGVTKRLQTTIEESNQSITNLDQSMIEVKTTSEQQMHSVNATTGSMEKLISSIQDISGLIKEQSSNVEIVTQDLESMVHSINDISNVTESAQSISNSLQEIAKRGAKSIEKTLLSINDIESASAQVFEIIGIISGIAEQTDLLAMNAAIEAAHAGQFGKGFAVVSEEIRKLAENTTANAMDISSVLKEISTLISNSSQLSDESSAVLKNILGDITKMGGIINAVEGSVDILKNYSMDIMKSMRMLMEISRTLENHNETQLDMSNSIENAFQSLQNGAIKVWDSNKLLNQNAKSLIQSVEIVKQVMVKNKLLIDSFNVIIDIYRQKDETIPQEKLNLWQG